MPHTFRDEKMSGRLPATGPARPRSNGGDEIPHRAKEQTSAVDESMNRWAVWIPNYRNVGRTVPLPDTFSRPWACTA